MVGMKGIDRESWDAVAQRFARLGKDARRHFERVGEHGAAERAELDEALHRVVRDVESSLESVRDTIRDPALRKDIAKLAEAMRAALLGALPAVVPGSTSEHRQHHETTGRRATSSKHTVTRSAEPMDKRSGKPSGKKPVGKPATGTPASKARTRRSVSA